MTFINDPNPLRRMSYRREGVTYCGEHTDHNRVHVHVRGRKGEDEDGETLWQVHTETGKAFVAPASDLTPEPDAPEMLHETFERALNRFHPLMAGFMAEALVRYAEQTLADEAETRRQMAGTMIGAEAWLECARTTRDLFDLSKRARQAEAVAG